MQIDINREIDRLPAVGRALLLAAVSQAPGSRLTKTAGRSAQKIIERRIERRQQRSKGD